MVLKTVAFAVGMAALLSICAASSAQDASVQCQVDGHLVTLADIPEASGVALGHGSAERLWVINDSGQPIVYSVDLEGRIADRVRVAGATVEDWEDLAAAPCPQGRCLYIADIGDNRGHRSRITIYRVPEPAPGAVTTAPAEAFYAAYPDGSHNAEGFFVDEDGRVLVVTKDRSTAIYRSPSAFTPGGTTKLEKVASMANGVALAGAPGSGKGGPGRELATGAALSADRNWIAIRSHHMVLFFRTKDVAAGHLGDPIRAAVTDAHEPQGEAITFGPAGSIYLVGEGGKKGRPGTLTKMTCALPR